MRDKIVDFLKDVNREGVVEFTRFLDESDFYTAPCSTKFHLPCEGGLVEHTVNVTNCALELNEKYGNICPDDSVILAAIGHDLCKVNFYKQVDEGPTDAQMRYLTSLTTKAGIRIPAKLNKAYVGTLIDFMLKTYKKGMIIPPYTPNYQIEDQMPLGHGEKSLFIMSQFFKLTLEESLAIRWHMGAFDLNFESLYQKSAYNEAVKNSKLVTILQLADLEATNLLEVV
jgi:hypothetical protein